MKYNNEIKIVSYGNYSLFAVEEIGMLVGNGPHSSHN
jgi:hypothetical protein